MSDRRRLLESLADYLDQLCEEGLGGAPVRTATQPQVPEPRPPLRTEAPPSLASGQSPAPAEAVETSAPIPPSDTAEQTPEAYPGLSGAASLEELRAFIGDCGRCKLAPGRTNLVFGVGNPQAEVMFIGEGPGADEDLRGEPFVGRAGQLLTDIIERGMRIARSSVYIANVVKCRPPGNRNPEPDEVAACRPFLIRQIALIRPKVIVALGTFAAQALLQVKTPISRLRGNWHEVEGIRLMPTFHPAYLLRNAGDKRLVWADIQEVMKALGWKVPRPGER